MYKFFLKPLLFRFAPERAHALTVRLLKIVLAIPLIGFLFRKAYEVKHPRLEREVFGLKFPNPVGLAAGFDKDGKYFEAMGALGFGFVEIGTVTPKGQIGNPQPRLFRLPEDKALINRMGFNNEGVEALVKRLKNTPRTNFIIGGNIGKNKVTPNEQAVEDYKICFEALYPYVDYFVVNVSSPNTPGLRELQERGPLTEILTTVQALNQAKTAPKPVLLKIAPDLNEHQLDDILEIVEETGLSGIIATNTTIERKPLISPSHQIDAIGAGGLSGAPLGNRSTEIIKYISTKTAGKLPIIGVGGIVKAEDATEKLKAGASLVQVYSGLVYSGPRLVKNINRHILKNL